MLLFGQLEVPTWLLLCVMGVLLIYILGKRNQDYLKNLGLPGPSWSMPILGEFPSLAWKGLYQFDLDLMNTYGKTVGFMEGRDASIMSKDIGFLKQVMIKEWYNFPNHRNGGDSIQEYGVRTMLPQVEGEQWKRIRSHMSPTFSTGKLKKMVDIINLSGDNLAENLTGIAKKDELCDPKDAFGFFTMDVLTGTAFGIQVNTAQDKDNEFVKHAKRFFLMSFYNPLLIAFVLAPFLLKPMLKMGFSFVPKDSSAFIQNIVTQAIKARKDSHYDRVDFLQLMINAQTSDAEGEAPLEMTMDEKEKEVTVEQEGNLQTGVRKSGMSEEEIMGNAMIFFVAGYDTTASTLQFLVYELAVNPEIQERVIQEVDDVCGKEKPTYEMVGKMKYLDMCIQETLRLYPVAIRTDRICANSTTIDGITIPKGMVIDISIIGIHRDPDIYPNPDVFDPERFTPEAKAARDPLTHMPFGAGPRNCIGMRMALLESKIGMAMALQKVRFLRCEATQVPLKIGSVQLLAPDKPIQVKLQLRE